LVWAWSFCYLVFLGLILFAVHLIKPLTVHFILGFSLFVFRPWPICFPFYSAFLFLFFRKVQSSSPLLFGPEPSKISILHILNNFLH
jgi:hypothetical protein